MEKKDVINFAVGASMLAAAACGAKPDASNTNIENQNSTETPLTQTYTPQETAEQQNPLISPVEELPKPALPLIIMEHTQKSLMIIQENEISWHEGNMIEEGTNDLTDLKVDGGKVEFEMPKDGIVNSIAGEIKISTENENGVETVETLIPGNPAMDKDGNPIITAGTTVSINYQPNNESNGLAIILKRKTFENLRMDWGEYGISKAVYDENKRLDCIIG